MFCKYEDQVKPRSRYVSIWQHMRVERCKGLHCRTLGTNATEHINSHQNSWISLWSGSGNCRLGDKHMVKPTSSHLHLSFTGPGGKSQIRFIKNSETSEAPGPGWLCLRHHMWSRSLHQGCKNLSIFLMFRIFYSFEAAMSSASCITSCSTASGL